MMKHTVVVLAGFLFLFGLGCARVRVEAPKEPIKLDIAMRLDIYQHVAKDIDAIEGIVSGSPQPSVQAGPLSLLSFALDTAYAQEELDPQVQQAALRRRDRYQNCMQLCRQGIIGENKEGLLVSRNAAGDSQKALIDSENSDRMVIYAVLATKNKSSVAEIQKAYAQRLQKDAPTGTPIEVYDSSSGGYAWKIKE